MKGMLGSAAVACAAAILLVVAAEAGEYHYDSTLLCADCHTMHFSMQHNWDGSTPVPTSPQPGGNWMGATGPNASLLKLSANDLCASCHDGQSFAPDVVGANVNTYARLGGALPTGTAPYEQWKGHTLVGSYEAPGGGGLYNPLKCINCHAYHGNTNYRNLDGTSAPISYAKGTNDSSKDVFLRGWTPGDLAGNYGLDAMDYNEPKTADSALSKFCAVCHSAFHYEQTEVGGSPWLRHPSRQANIGALNPACTDAGGNHSCLSIYSANSFRVKVMSPVGDWGPNTTPWVGAPTTLTPTCTSCHRAHGSANAFGLIYPLGSEPNDATRESGQGTNVVTLCGHCHRQG